MIKKRRTEPRSVTSLVASWQTELRKSLGISHQCTRCGTEGSEVHCATTARRGDRDVGTVELMQPCCTHDEGRPLGLGLQGRGPNYRERRRSKDRGRERHWKRREASRQVSAGKTNASEPLRTCRN